jgi:hypothetical protein
VQQTRDTIDLLDELVQRGLLRTVEAGASRNLDFTSNINLRGPSADSGSSTVKDRDLDLPVVAFR